MEGENDAGTLVSDRKISGKYGVLNELPGKLMIRGNLCYGLLNGSIFKNKRSCCVENIWNTFDL